ncbi:MAG: 2,3-diaminopropionate biosynthesis protein SbnB [Candidatus Parabeggiatoa sp. nov. 1]|nr:MAG: 2,3-diaminopropionate biosynthesis protein SbnB [Gammaproteobacteria bacterium]
MKQTDELLIVTGEEVRTLLDGREKDIIHVVGEAYKVHEQGESVLPHSSFLRFPDNNLNRIIALPAFLGGSFNVAGIKWVASFPENLQQGIDRASATLVLNSVATGRPEVFMDASIINGKRTAASAALAAQCLHADQKLTSAGLLGCGFINFEIGRFLIAVFPELKHMVLYDIDTNRADFFKEKIHQQFEQIEKVTIAKGIPAMLSETKLVSLATTVGTPYLADISPLQPGSTILNISLRDMTPEVILQGDNVVDDADHVCRAQTSLHLVEQQVGHRDFIRCSLASILLDKQPARKMSTDISIFSPFGLGILDIALAQLVSQFAKEAGKGMKVPSFLPESWFNMS